MDHYRPSLADATKTGFFRQDVASQTDESEILDVKGMISLFKGLNEEINDARNDLSTATRIIKSEYETTLSSHLATVYERTNDRLRFIEESNGKTIGRVRHSCRSQVYNELARSFTNCEKKYTEKHKQVTDEHAETCKKLRHTIKVLKKSLQYKEDIQTAHEQYMATLEAHLKKAGGEVPEMNFVKPLPVESVKEDDGPQRELKLKEDQISQLTRDLNHALLEGSQLRTELDDVTCAAAKHEGKYEALASELAATSEASTQQIDILTLQVEEVSRHLETVTAERDKIAQINDEASGAKIKEALRKNTQELHRQYKKEMEQLKQLITTKETQFAAKLKIMEQSVSNVKDPAYMKALIQKQGSILKYATLLHNEHGANQNPSVENAPREFGHRRAIGQLPLKNSALPAIESDADVKERHVHFSE